jgi:hypothetical protein
MRKQPVVRNERVLDAVTCLLDALCCVFDVDQFAIFPQFTIALGDMQALLGGMINILVDRSTQTFNCTWGHCFQLCVSNIF